MILTVANMLTITRLVLTPFFVAVFFLGQPVLAFVIFCVAGFTDMIDGTVARFFGQPSKGGALLDPIADKFLVQSCFFSLAYTGFLPWWFFLMALARDIMIVSGIIYLERIKAELPYRPSWSSKFATLFQLVVAGLGLLRNWLPAASFAGFSLIDVHFAAIVIATVLIAVSGAGYVSMGIDILHRHDKQHNV